MIIHYEEVDKIKVRWGDQNKETKYWHKLGHNSKLLYQRKGKTIIEIIIKYQELFPQNIMELQEMNEEIKIMQIQLKPKCKLGK